MFLLVILMMSVSRKSRPFVLAVLLVTLSLLGAASQILGFVPRSGLLPSSSDPVNSSPPTIYGPFNGYVNNSIACGAAANCFITSNGTISSLRYGTNSIHFAVAGTQGTTAFVNATVPDSVLPNPSRLQVLINDTPLPNSAVILTPNGSADSIYFTFPVQAVNAIEIRLQPLPQQASLLSTVLLYSGIGLPVLAILTAVFLIIRRSRKRNDVI